jgi:transposase-like protein/IS1 family transposase
MNLNFDSFIQMITVLPDDNACRQYLELQRWNGIPTCPHCGVIDKKHYRLTVKGEFKGMYKCKSCQKRFTVTIGTMFEGSPIPLRKWFIAAYIFSAHKKGISSYQLSRDLGVTQKTAWFMLHRLRQAFTDIEPKVLTDVVSMDETFIGGKEKNKPLHKRKEGSQGGANKAIVAGAMQIGGIVVTKVIADRSSETITDIVKKMVKKGSILVTDEHRAYYRVKKDYFHIVVNHSEGEYVNGVFSTNNIEGFWSLLKRGIIGIYHQITPKHLQAYCEEFGFRYNSRKITDKDRFDITLKRTEGIRLQYSELIK